MVKPEELIRAEQLIDEGKYDDALQLMKNFEETGEHTLYEIVSCHLLKCELLFQQSLYEDLVKFADQTYNESLGLGKNLQSVDALMWMARALLWLYRLDKAFDIIKQGEELLKTLTQELPIDYKRGEVSIESLKGGVYQNKGDADRALEHYKHSLALREEIGAKKEIAKYLNVIAMIVGYLQGELDRALKYAERGLALAKESNNKYQIASCLNNMAILYINKGEPDRALKYAERGLALAKESNNKYQIASSLNIMAKLYYNKGELDRSIILNEQSLAIFKELNIKTLLAHTLNNVGGQYIMKGELDRALECLEQSLALHQEVGKLGNIASVYDYLIQILIDKGDLERAQQHLHDLEQINNKLKDKGINLIYLFNKALILKTSSRARNRVKAEEILEQLLEDKNLSNQFTIGALINLCELLLIELRITNDLEVLDEIDPLIARLLDNAEKSNSYWVLAETYLLQAKLSLLTFNIKKSQRFLTQAQQIAERFSFNQLAMRIVNENKDLLKKLDLWERLEESGAPMADRLELARLDEKMIGIVYKHTDLITQVTVEKVAISKEKKICLVCRGEVLRFSYICECGAIYCGNCAQALTNLENVCWACDVPIDYLKPVKPFKEEEEIVKVEEKAKKK